MDILIVQNSSDLSTTLKEALSHESYNLHTASSGDEAEKLISKTNFEACIIDFLLPDCKGNELVLKIEKAKFNKMPKIILISGFLDEKTILNLIPKHLHSIISFIKKPIDTEILLKKLTASNTSTSNLSITFHNTDNDLESYISRNKTFDNYHLINILFIIYELKFNGKLLINFNSKSKKEIYFNNGCAYQVKSLGEVNSENYFGNLLIKNGFALEEEVEQALQEQDSGMKMGHILLEKGLLSPDMITFVLKEQITIQLSELISQNSFIVSDIETHEVKNMGNQNSSLTQEDLINFAIECIKKKIPDEWMNTFYIKNKSSSPTLNKFIRPQQNGIHEDFLNYYKEIIKKVDGGHSVEQIINSYPKESRSAALKAVYFGVISNSLSFNYRSNQKQNMERSEAIVKLISQNTSGDLFKNLNLPWRASHEEIEKTYKKLISILHPDALPQDISDEKKDLYQNVFKKVVHSYEILSDPEKYEQYISEQDNKKFMDILLRYKEGVKFLKKKNYLKAIEIFQEISDNSNAPKHTEMYLLWAKIKHHSYELKMKRDVAMQIQKSIDNLPMEHKITHLYWFISGLYHKYCGRDTRALSELKKSIKIKPLKEAQDEIIKIKQNTKKSSKQNGFLSKFLGSKKAS